jgi:hypothetical protein
MHCWVFHTSFRDQWNSIEDQGVSSIRIQITVYRLTSKECKVSMERKLQDIYPSRTAKCAYAPGLTGSWSKTFERHFSDDQRSRSLISRTQNPQNPERDLC